MARIRVSPSLLSATTILALTAGLLGPRLPVGQADRREPIDLGHPPWAGTHEDVEIEGFRLRVATALRKKPELRKATLREVQHQLYQLQRMVPNSALARLRQVTIFVEARSKTPCMAYHPSKQWLTNNQHNPDHARCVELGNPATFLAWTKAQPWMVLHELAHAYHHQFLEGGFRNALLARHFAAAKKGGRYDQVLHIQGRDVRSYALTNQQEYFAEATEAYFGTNDMYPFVRAELKKHDPELFAAMATLWGRD